MDVEYESPMQMASASASSSASASATDVILRRSGDAGTKRSKMSNTHCFIAGESQMPSKVPVHASDLWGDCPSSEELAVRGLEDRAAAATVGSFASSVKKTRQTSWALTGSSFSVSTFPPSPTQQ